MAEILDIYDANMTHIGTMERKHVHRTGMWHRTFQCWIVAERPDGHRYLLFHERSTAKKNHPLRYDATAAGHLNTGEKPEDGVRELEEELGIKADFSDLHYLGIKVDVADYGWHRNREFADVYLLRRDDPLASYDPDPDEISAVLEVRLAAAIELFSGRVESVEANCVELFRGKPVESTREIRKEDFITRIDSYYLQIALLGQLFFEGHELLVL